MTPDLFENLEIDPNTLPKADEISYQPLATCYQRVMLLKHVIGALIGWGVLAVISFIPTLSYSLWWHGAAALVILLWLLVSLGLLRRSFGIKGYALREHDISYRQGLIFTRWITLPYNKIQEVKVGQGPLDRLMTLYTLTLSNAAVGDGTLTIEGLYLEQAEAMKAFVLARAQRR